MNIKELRFIHDLLREEVAARKAVKQNAANELEDAEESSNPFTVQTARNRLDEASEKYFEASRVLQSFEDEEWK